MKAAHWLVLAIGVLATVLAYQQRSGASVVPPQAEQATSKQVCGTKVNLAATLKDFGSFDVVWRGQSNDRDAPGLLELLQDEAEGTYFLIKTSADGVTCILDAGTIEQAEPPGQRLTAPGCGWPVAPEKSV